MMLIFVAVVFCPP